MRLVFSAAFCASLAILVGVACKLDDPDPDPVAPASLDVIPTSREVYVSPGSAAAFAVQIKAASGEALDDVDAFVSVDPTAPFTFELPVSSTKGSARAKTQREVVSGFVVEGAFSVRLAVDPSATPGVYPVFCALTSLADDAGDNTRPLVRVNIIVDAVDASRDAAVDGGTDAS